MPSRGFGLRSGFLALTPCRREAKSRRQRFGAARFDGPRGMAHPERQALLGCTQTYSGALYITQSPMKKHAREARLTAQGMESLGNNSR